MKTKIFVLSQLFACIAGFSQVDCATVSISPNVVYLDQDLDSAAFIAVEYTGSTDVSYSLCSFIFDDTSNINITDTAVTNGVDGSFIFEPFDGYEVTYNNPDIPPGTVVNAQFHIYHGALGDPNAASIDCYVPITFVINANLNVDAPEFTQLLIYPNPSAGELWLDNSFGDYDVSLYDTTGRLMHKTHCTEKKSQLDVSQLSPGMYSLLIVKDGNSAAKKFLKY